MSLTTAIKRLQTLAMQCGAMRYAPDNPVDSSAVYPYSIAYVVEGRIIAESAYQARDFHTINVEFHIAPPTNMALAIEKVLPYVEEYGHKLVSDPTLNSTVDTIVFDEGVRYRFGRLITGPNPNDFDYGVSFSVPVKIRTATT